MESIFYAIVFHDCIITGFNQGGVTPRCPVTKLFLGTLLYEVRAILQSPFECELCVCQHPPVAGSSGLVTGNAAGTASV